MEKMYRHTILSFYLVLRLDKNQINYVYQTLEL